MKVIAYKGFHKDWKCRDYQFKVGEKYEHEGDVSKCNSGFHSCEYPLDVFAYYEPAISHYAIVEASGKIDRETDGDTKLASAQIYVKAEIHMPDLIAAAIKWVTDKCDPVKAKHSTGYQSASSATVLCNHDADYNIRHIRASKVGENGIKPDTYYVLNDAGEFVEA